MLSFAKLTAVSLTASLLPMVLLAGAPDAVAQERCSGTLCDFYYGSSSSFDDKPAPKAPTPVMVPRGTILGMFSGSNGQQPASASGTAAPTTRPIVGVGGGGIAAMARGEKAEQCSGTLCDFYYGKSSSFDDKSTQDPTTGAPVSQVAAETAPEPATETAPDQRGFETRPEPPRCASAGRDPWSCYR